MALSENHRRVLEVESGMARDDVDARGYRTVGVDEVDVLARLGFASYQRRVPGLLIPVRDDTGEIVTHEYRPDSPRLKDGKPVKYENKPGVSPCLDVPVRARTRLNDASVDLWITEGAKKADSAVSKGLCCVALGGVWAFRRKKASGGSETIPDLDRIPLQGRRIVLCYDSDVMQKASVRGALDALAQELTSRGARVDYAVLDAASDAKVGLDDYLANGGDPYAIRTFAPTDMPPGSGKAAKRGSDQADGSQAADIEKAALESGLELWRDPSGEAFATFPKDGHSENARCDGEALQAFLFSVYRKAKGRAPTMRALQEAAQRLALVARYEGPQWPTSTRIYSTATESFLFLADEAWRVVRIEGSGWRLLSEGEQAPVRFLRAGNADALPVPESGGTLTCLREVLSVSETGFEFSVAWLLGCFLPKGGLPILLATGEQGSGKTSGCRFLRSVVDPNRMPLRNLPKDARGLAAAVRSNHVLGFDNVSHISHELSDLLCSVSTGMGIASHALYKDAEEFCVPARAPMILNGIGEIATRADLLDRSLPVSFLRIDGTGRRRSERELEGEFRSVHARILGSLLDRVATAYRNLPGRPLQDDLPRHADLGAWVTASEQEETRGTFLSLLRTTRAEQGADVVEGDSLAAMVAELVRDDGPVEGSASEILSALNARLTLLERPKNWPQSPVQLASRLQRLAPTLRQAGVHVEQQPRTAARRTWRIGGSQAVLERTADGPHDDATSPSQRASYRDTSPSRSETTSNDGDDARDSLLPLSVGAGRMEDGEWEAIR